MDTRWLRSFVEVVYHQSISRAAEHLGYTQQAVSQHVARLEQTLGATLLHRGPRGVTITTKGERVYFRAQSVLDEVDLMAQELRSEQDFVGTDAPRGKVLPLPPGARATRQANRIDVSDDPASRRAVAKQTSVSALPGSRQVRTPEQNPGAAKSADGTFGWVRRSSRRD